MKNRLFCPRLLAIGCLLFLVGSLLLPDDSSANSKRRKFGSVKECMIDEVISDGVEGSYSYTRRSLEHDDLIRGTDWEFFDQDVLLDHGELYSTLRVINEGLSESQKAARLKYENDLKNYYNDFLADKDLLTHYTASARKMLEENLLTSKSDITGLSGMHEHLTLHMYLFGHIPFEKVKKMRIHPFYEEALAMIYTKTRIIKDYLKFSSPSFNKSDPLRFIQNELRFDRFRDLPRSYRMQIVNMLEDGTIDGNDLGKLLEVLPMTVPPRFEKATDMQSFARYSAETDRSIRAKIGHDYISIQHRLTEVDIDRKSIVYEFFKKFAKDSKGKDKFKQKRAFLALQRNIESLFFFKRKSIPSVNVKSTGLKRYETRLPLRHFDSDEPLTESRGIALQVNDQKGTGRILADERLHLDDQRDARVTIKNKEHFGTSKSDLLPALRIQSLIDQGKIKSGSLVLESSVNLSAAGIYQITKYAPDISVIKMERLPSGRLVPYILAEGSGGRIYDQIRYIDQQALSDRDLQYVADLNHMILTSDVNQTWEEEQIVLAMKKILRKKRLGRNKSKVHRIVRSKEALIKIESKIMSQFDTQNPLSPEELKKYQTELRNLRKEMQNREARDAYQAIFQEASSEFRKSNKKKKGFQAPGHRRSARMTGTRAFTRIFEQLLTQRPWVIKAFEKRFPNKAVEPEKFVQRADRTAKKLRDFNRKRVRREMSGKGPLAKAREERRKFGFKNARGRDTSDTIPIPNIAIMLDSFYLGERDPFRFVDEAGNITKREGQKNVFGIEEFKKRLKSPDAFDSRGNVQLFDPLSRFTEADMRKKGFDLVEENTKRLMVEMGGFVTPQTEKIEKTENEIRKLGMILGRKRQAKKAKTEIQYTPAEQELVDRYGRDEIVNMYQANKLKLIEQKRDRYNDLLSAATDVQKSRLIEEKHLPYDAKIVYHIDSANEVRFYDEGLIEQAGRPSHMQIGGGRDPVLAGQLFLKKVGDRWTILEIDDGSGHYQPFSENLEYMKNLLEKKYGIDCKNTRLVRRIKPFVGVRLPYMDQTVRSVVPYY